MFHWDRQVSKVTMLRYSVAVLNDIEQCITIAWRCALLVHSGRSYGWSPLISSGGCGDNAFIHIRPRSPSVRYSWLSTSVHNTIDGRITTGNELPAARRRYDLSVIVVWSAFRMRKSPACIIRSRAKLLETVTGEYAYIRSVTLPRGRLSLTEQTVTVFTATRLRNDL